MSTKKILIILVAGVMSVSVFTFTAKPVIAQENTAYAIQTQIEALLKKIIALLQQIIEIKQSQLKEQNSGPTFGEGETGRLTVTATGVTAYVSINGANPFPYVSSIILNEGDTYVVEASLNEGGSSSKSRCSGIVSGGGNHTCNISINN